MDIRISFKLRKPNAVSPTGILLYIYHKDFQPEGRLVVGVGQSILPALFDKTSERPSKDRKLLKGLSREELRTLGLLDDRLNSFQNAARKAYEFFYLNNAYLNANLFKDKLYEELGKKSGKSVEGTQQKVELNEYIQQYIDDLLQQKRTTASGQVYAPGSVKNYLTFKAQFDLFQKKIKRQLTFVDVTQDFYNDFVRFLNSKNYSPNTIGKHIARLKVLLRAAKQDGWHKNVDYEKSTFKVLRVNTDSVYLTEDELMRIRQVDLVEDSGLELYRDVFLIGCYTAQRVSDYKSVRPENVTQTSKGRRILKLIQKKTGETVMIPIGTELEQLLKKYDYHPPKVYDQKLNDAIKKVCKLAGITNLVEVEEIKGGKKERKVVEKWAMVHSHTARRTGATLMYLAGVPTIDIMKITGHRKEGSFMKYIRTTKEETADKLADHPYFK